MLAKLAKPFQSQISKFSRKFSELSAAKSTGVVKREKLQFSKKRLTDWGELPLGEIPDALQYDLPFGKKTINFIINHHILIFQRSPSLPME